ncbi:MAG TPA: GFA family protein [Caulobacteraceae bacterium]|jgi:hypothetical protein
MVTRVAECRCGQLKAACEGEPVWVSVCHCHNCQRRSGSAFAAQARWPAEQVTVTGDVKVWTQRGDEGGLASFRFCPQCGATVAYELDTMPGLVAVAWGAFAGQELPPPRISNYEVRKPPWVEITVEGVEHLD